MVGSGRLQAVQFIKLQPPALAWALCFREPTTPTDAPSPRCDLTAPSIFLQQY